MAGPGSTGRAALVVRAEQALLGSVLSDPAGQGYVLDLVRSEDFWRPYHGQVVVAMQQLRGSGHTPGPEAVYREIRNNADLPGSVSGDAVLLVDLMQAAPRPSHATAYAGIVIGGGMRRRISLTASRMCQAAQDRDLTNAVAMTRRARWEIWDCHHRWMELPESVRRELPPVPGVVPGRRSLAQSAGEVRDEIRRLRRELLAGGEAVSGRQLTPLARRVAELAEASVELHEQDSVNQGEPRAGPGHREESETEDRAVRDLIAGPFQVGSVGGWLRADHFTHPRHKAVYQVMQDLAADGQPVDPVTVAWEASRRGIAVDVAELSGGTSAFAVNSARAVARSGILAQIGEAARAVQTEAANRILPTEAVVRRAGERLDDMQRQWPQRVVTPASPAVARSLGTPVLPRQAERHEESVREASS